MFLVNSRSGHFSAAHPNSGRKVHPPGGHPLSRSYGVILPSSFAKNHSSTLGFSPRLRVSVYGTVTGSAPIEVFLGSMIRASLWAKCPPHRVSRLFLRICLEELPTRLDRDIRHPAGLSLLRHPIGQTPHQWYRNVSLFSIAYAFRPRLRVRLTLSGLTFLRKP